MIDEMARKVTKRSMRGRKSIYRGKDREGRRVGGIMTKKGLGYIEQSRARLATLAQRPVDEISDSDLIEYLARRENNAPAFDG